MRGILPVAEEQSRTRGSQSGGVEDQPQCRGCCIVAAPVHAPSLASLLLPLLLSQNLPLPRAGDVCVGTTQASSSRVPLPLIRRIFAFSNIHHCTVLTIDPLSSGKVRSIPSEGQGPSQDMVNGASVVHNKQHSPDPHPQTSGPTTPHEKKTT